jgi:hypothetical protein
MIDKAAALGLQFAASAVAQYKVPIAAKCALDEIHESWNPLWGFPLSRQIPNGGSLSQSVPCVANKTALSAWKPGHEKRRS